MRLAANAGGAHWLLLWKATYMGRKHRLSMVTQYKHEVSSEKDEASLNMAHERCQVNDFQGLPGLTMHPSHLGGGRLFKKRDSRLTLTYRAQIPQIGTQDKVRAVSAQPVRIQQCRQ